MESTGNPGKIQISQETADMLFESGKGRWIVRRQDTVVAKGKGELQTYCKTLIRRIDEFAAAKYRLIFSLLNRVVIPH